MSHDTNWNIDKYYDETESDELWELRREFMETHKDKYAEDFIVALAKVFTNVEFVGCSYYPDVMRRIVQLSDGVADSYREKKNKKRTFITTSDAAESKYSVNKKLRTDVSVTQTMPGVDSSDGEEKSDIEHKLSILRKARAQPGVRGQLVLIHNTVNEGWSPYSILVESAKMANMTIRIRNETANKKNSLNQYTLMINGEDIACGLALTKKKAKNLLGKIALERLQETCFTVKIKLDNLAYLFRGEVVNKEMLLTKNKSDLNVATESTVQFDRSNIAPENKARLKDKANILKNCPDKSDIGPNSESLLEESNIVPKTNKQLEEPEIVLKNCPKLIDKSAMTSNNKFGVHPNEFNISADNWKLAESNIVLENSRKWCEKLYMDSENKPQSGEINVIPENNSQLAESDIVLKNSRKWYGIFDMAANSKPRLVKIDILPENSSQLGESNNILENYQNSEESNIDPENKLQIDETNIGTKLMKLMGWRGRGLGKEETGRTKAIEAVPRLWRSGLGLEAQPKRNTRERKQNFDKNISASSTSLESQSDASKSKQDKRKRKNFNNISIDTPKSKAKQDKSNNNRSCGTEKGMSLKQELNLCIVNYLRNNPSKNLIFGSEFTGDERNCIHQTAQVHRLNAKNYGTGALKQVVVSCDGPNWWNIVKEIIKDGDTKQCLTMPTKLT